MYKNAIKQIFNYHICFNISVDEMFFILLNFQQIWFEILKFL